MGLWDDVRTLFGYRPLPSRFGPPGYEVTRQDDPTQGYAGLGTLTAPPAGTGPKQVRRYAATCLFDAGGAGGIFPICYLRLPRPWPQTGLSIDVDRIEWWTDTGIVYFGHPDFPIADPGGLGDETIVTVFQTNPLQTVNDSFLVPVVGSAAAPNDGGLFGSLISPSIQFASGLSTIRTSKALMLFPQDIIRDGMRGGSRAPFISIGLETSQRRQLVFQPDHSGGLLMLSLEWTERLG